MAKANLKKKLQFWGTGRRKKAIARVRLIPAGTGVITINDRAFEDYFPQSVLQYVVKQPLALLGVEAKYDVVVNVYRSGKRNPFGRCTRFVAGGRRQPPRTQERGFPYTRPPRKGKKEVRLEEGSPCASVLEEIIRKTKSKERFFNLSFFYAVFMF